MTATGTAPAVTDLARRAGALAVAATPAALILLAALHVLSPEFSPGWRMVSEYAFGRHADVLAWMFACWGLGTWALAAGLLPQVRGAQGRAGWWLLIAAGLGEAMAAVFDVRHAVGHGVAGALGVLGFPAAALLLSAALRQQAGWLPAARVLRVLAHLSWIAVVLLAATLGIMTWQMERITGGRLPHHAPKVLPPGVLPLDGWADRGIVLVNCAWVLVAGWHLWRQQRHASAGA